ncbi:MAG: hypothetical protein J7M08_06070 [Planctomycetes bacterium]|nr:hypothetical protein [Planctomycetota bacterium]
MKRLVGLTVIVVIVLVLVFEPSARRQMVELWQSTIGESLSGQARPVASYDEQRVYLPRHDTYYHRKGCPHMTGTGVPMKLMQARELAKPCPYCKPPR